MRQIGTMILGATLVVGAVGCGDDGGGGGGTTDARADTGGGGDARADTGGGGDTGGGDTGGGNGDFTINFTGYGPHDTQNYELAVFDGATMVGTVQTGMAAATFSVTIPGIIEAGKSYTVRWWIDLNGDGMCSAIPDDHMWELTGQMGTATGLTITHPHDTDWTDVCPSFP